MGEKVVKTREEILEAYQQIQNSYGKILEDKGVISEKLEDFVVGTPIGEGIYGEVSSLRGEDISLPADTVEFTKMMGDIRQDIDNVDALIKLNQDLYDYLSNESGLDPELSNIYSEVAALKGTLKTMRDNREEVYRDLDNTLTAVEDKPPEEESKPDDSGGGGGGFRPAPDTKRNDYKPVVTFPNLFDKTSISNTSTNLASHEEATAQLLSQLVINGKPIGGDAYNLDPNFEVGDVGFNFATLQLALDFVEGDITATTEYIAQLQQAIDDNEAKISENQSKMQEYDEVATYDDEGNWTGTFKVPKYDNAALQSEIDTLEAENTAYEEEKTLFNEKLEEKKKVQKELFAYRNACNDAMDGMLDLFTAESLLAAAQEGMFDVEPSLLGVPVSFESQSDMFEQLQLRLEESRQDYSKYVKSNDSANFDARMDEYDSIVAACKDFSAALSVFATLTVTPPEVDSLTVGTGGELNFDTADDCYDYYISIADQYDAQIEDLKRQYQEQKTEYNSVLGKLQDYNDQALYGWLTESDIEEVHRLEGVAREFEQLQADLTSAQAVLTQFRNYAFEQAFSMYLESPDFNEHSGLIISDYEYKFRPELSENGALAYSVSDLGNFMFYDANGERCFPTEFEIAEYFKYSIANGETDFGSFFAQVQQLSNSTGHGGFWEGGWKSNGTPPFDVIYNANAITGFYEEFRYLNDEELQMFNYFKNTGREDQLARYMESRKAISVQRHGYEEFLEVKTKIDQYYQEYPDGVADRKTFARICGTGFVDGLDRFADGIDNIFNADGQLSDSDYKSMYILQYLEELYGEEKFTRTVMKGGYNLSSTLGNMAPSLLIGTFVNPLAGAALMGASAGGNAREKGLQMGMSQFSAAMYGLLNGLSEAALQYVLGGIDKLGSGAFSKSVERLVHSKFLANMLSEGFEESVQEILDPLFASMVTGGDIPFEIDWKQVGEAGIYGMLAAGLIGGGEITFNGIRYSINNGVDMSSIPTGLTLQETINELCEKGVLTRFNDTILGLNGINLSTESEFTQKSAELLQQFDEVRRAYKNHEISEAEFEAAKSEFRSAIKKIHPDVGKSSSTDTNASTNTNTNTNTETNAPNIEQMQADLSSLSETSEETDNLSSLIEELAKNPEANQAALRHLQNKVNQIVEADAQAQVEAEANVEAEAKAEVDEDMDVQSMIDDLLEKYAAEDAAAAGDTSVHGSDAAIQGPSTDTSNNVTNAAADVVAKPGNGNNAQTGITAETDTGTGTPVGNTNVHGSDAAIDGPSTNPTGTTRGPNAAPEVVAKPGNKVGGIEAVMAETDTGTGTPAGNTTVQGSDAAIDGPSTNPTGTTRGPNAAPEVIAKPGNKVGGIEAVMAETDTGTGAPAGMLLQML